MHSRTRKLQLWLMYLMKYIICSCWQHLAFTDWKAWERPLSMTYVFPIFRFDMIFPKMNWLWIWLWVTCAVICTRNQSSLNAMMSINIHSFHSQTLSFSFVSPTLSPFFLSLLLSPFFFLPPTLPFFFFIPKLFHSAVTPCTS